MKPPAESPPPVEAAATVDPLPAQRKNERALRLAAALRENLRRRKAAPPARPLSERN